MIRLLICDDAEEARAALRTMLAEHPEIEIVGEAASGGEVIARAVELSPDVILMDVRMPVIDGVEATRRIRELTPGTRIVAFTGSNDRETVTAMLDAGASAYCVKGAPLWELERAIAGSSEPLVRLAHALARSVPGMGVAQLVARELAELSCAAFVATYVTAPDVGLSLAGLDGATSSPALSAAPGVVQRAFNEAQPESADAKELAELYRLAGMPCAEALALPLVADGDVLGVLLVAMPANVQLELDAELVAAVGDLAAAALANQRRLALTYAEARRDALTGLPNRRAFEEHLDRVLEEWKDTTLVLLDVDDFKPINDREGHGVGDQVLREVSRGLLRAVRADEEAFRIGGDEFALVVKGDAAAGLRLAERLQTGLASQRRGHLPLPTVSAGVASFPADAAAKAALLLEADTALYSAKQTGKNRVVVRRGEGGGQPRVEVGPAAPARPVSVNGTHARPAQGLHVLCIDDDPGLRMLLRTTFEIIDIEVEEAESVAEARMQIALRRPDAVVLDVALPGIDGIAFCRELKGNPETSDIAVVVLSGLDDGASEAAAAAGADAFLPKPFSPLELLAAIEQSAGGLPEGPFRLMTDARPEEQLLLYAQDLRRLLEIERGQRLLLQSAWQETVGALSSALETKDTGTSAHSQRVRRYARELTVALEPRLLDDASLEFGFLLHDVGKIGIPDRILAKPGPLTGPERGVMQTHAPLGEQMLSRVALLKGEGLRVIRSHHERWDGAGYPDGLSGEEIPLGGRIFAVADALDAMTSDRPYRVAGDWDRAACEIVGQAGRQFDPKVVDAFRACEPRLRAARRELQRTALMT